MINLKHPLVILSQRIDWRGFELKFGQTYHDSDGRPGVPIRVYVGLHYLKHTFHAPEVECIPKGKAHKCNEFGCKVSPVTTSKKNWIVGVKALHNNPYDDHTPDEAIKGVESLTGMAVRNAYVDLGYRGHNYQGPCQVHMVDQRKMKQLTRSVRNWFKRRSAIEQVSAY